MANNNGLLDREAAKWGAQLGIKETKFGSKFSIDHLCGMNNSKHTADLFSTRTLVAPIGKGKLFAPLSGN